MSERDPDSDPSIPESDEVPWYEAPTVRVRAAPPIDPSAIEGPAAGDRPDPREPRRAG